MESTPYSVFIAGLTKRQPMVVSKISGAAREGAIGLGHDERRAAHALDAAGDDQIVVAAQDGAGGVADGFQARGAEPVDRHARHLDRIAGQQQGHAGDVAVVLAGLVGAAQDHFVDGREVEAGIARGQGLQRDRRQVIGPHLRQGAAIAAEGGANSVTDIRGCRHAKAPVQTLVLSLTRAASRVTLGSGP
jgi:hypothetical protein